MLQVVPETKCPHLVREYLGVRVRFKVFGLWNTTEKRGFRDFFHVFFLTALAAWAALPLASLAAGCVQLREMQQGGHRQHETRQVGVNSTSAEREHSHGRAAVACCAKW